MREIKFRAWDVVSKSWVEVDMGNNSKSASTKPISKAVVFAGNGECIIEQYIGLKDKNGVEIYEGDIILFNNKTIAGVQWNESTSGFEIARISDKFKSGVILGEDIKVIGNVHENPELLK